MKNDNCCSAEMQISTAITADKPNPDAHWVLHENGKPVARCSAWWRQTPLVENRNTGFIGHYHSEHAAAGQRLLNHACQQLAQQGCALALGPINGSIWHPYRFTIERGTHPLFALEQDHPQDWPKHFRTCGFSPVAHYQSTLHNSVDYNAEFAIQISQKMSDIGVVIRPFNSSNSETELNKIFAVSLQSFTDSFLYTPISQAEFLDMYRPLTHLIDPDLILIATQGDKPVGFIFALPNWLDANSSGNGKALVIKTIAILPDRIYKGLGHLLWASLYRRARKAGFNRAIHAFMREDNRTFEVSSASAQTIRRYALFGKKLFSREPGK